METINLNLEEVNELSFKLRVEGRASGRVSARLYCESENGVMHAFSGQFNSEPETVTFKLSQMNKIMSEGCYPAWVEVLIENKQFVPARFNIKFAKPVEVQVESLQVQIQESKKQPTVTASTLVVKKQVEQPKLKAKSTLVENLSQPEKIQFVESSKPVEHLKPILKESAKTNRVSITGLDDLDLENVTKSVLSKLNKKTF
jgi:hypothetical protein